MTFIIVIAAGGLLSYLIFRIIGSGFTGSTVRTLTPGNTALSALENRGMAKTDQYEDWITDPAYWWMIGNIYYNSNDSTDQATADQDWINNPACSHMPGNIYHNGNHCSCTGSDWINDPACYYMPGNIYYNDSIHSNEQSSSAFSQNDSQNGDSHHTCSYSSDDWMTDPCCSYMAGNIYHHEDDICSSGRLCDDDHWNSTSSTSYTFDDDWNSSTSSSISGDDWHSSTSSDDSWQSSSFNDDDW